MENQPELDGQSPGFPGHLLRQAREKYGLSQQEAARDLRLTSKVINAIEEDDFKLIPSFVFARGYIRSYAHHVGSDGQALVAEFDAAYGVPNNTAKLMSAIPQSSQPSQLGDTWVKLITIVFVIGLIAASIAWWQSQNSSQIPSLLASAEVDAPTGETVVEDIDTDDANLNLLLLTANESEVDAAVAEAEQVQNIEVAEIVAAVADTAIEVVVDGAVLSPNQAQLVIAFYKDCWVEIKDGNGKMILSDLYSAGDTIDQVVTAPIEVFLGRSSGVSEMTFDGQTIDLKPHTRKDIKRITLRK